MKKVSDWLYQDSYIRILDSGGLSVNCFLLERINGSDTCNQHCRNKTLLNLSVGTVGCGFLD